MEQKDNWGLGVDEMRFALLIKRRWGILVAAALAGALLAGVAYLLIRQCTRGEAQYRAETLYFIGYDIQEEDEVLKAFINEYNAYTWGDIMRSDKVMGAVMEQLADVERSVVEASVDTAIASDPEFLTAYFTTGDPALSDRIAAAYQTAMADFAETMRGRGLYRIEAWKTVPAALLEAENRVKNAAALGAVLGFLAGLLGLFGWCVLDDTILTERDVEERYPYRVLGYRTKRGGTDWDLRAKGCCESCAAGGRLLEISCQEALSPDADPAAWKGAEAVVLLATWGKSGHRLLGHAIRQLENRQVNLKAVLLVEADSAFLDCYYGVGHRRAKGRNGR